MHTIRPEQPQDVAEIDELIRAAFQGRPHAEGDEAEFVAALRARGDLVHASVATRGTALVGHSACAPVRAPGHPGTWFILAVVAVSPRQQCTGIGSALVRSTLHRLDADGAAGCFVVGHPSWYARFGFRLAPACCPPGQPAAAFLALPLRGSLPEQAVILPGPFQGLDPRSARRTEGEKSPRRSPESRR